LSIQGRRSKILNSAIQALARDGVHISSAAGNMAADACSYSPASVLLDQDSSVISVGASNPNDRLAPFSNFGPCVSLYAPGTDIRSVFADSTTQYVELSGTSMASPLVAGAVAVLLSETEAAEASPLAIKRRMLEWAATPRTNQHPTTPSTPDSPVALPDDGDPSEPLVDPIAFLWP
ncbi:hypothetical protein HK405_014168, partial [Cladochytrium tenue]